MQKVCILGNVSKIESENIKFSLAEEYLKEQHYVPITFNVQNNKLSSDDYKSMYEALIKLCDIVYVLDFDNLNLQNKLLLDYAKLHNKKILYDNDERYKKWLINNKMSDINIVNNNGTNKISDLRMLNIDLSSLLVYDREDDKIYHLKGYSEKGFLTNDEKHSYKPSVLVNADGVIRVTNIKDAIIYNPDINSKVSKILTYIKVILDINVDIAKVYLHLVSNMQINNEGKYCYSFNVKDLALYLRMSKGKLNGYLGYLVQHGYLEKNNTNSYIVKL